MRHWYQTLLLAASVLATGCTAITFGDREVESEGIMKDGAVYMTMTHNGHRYEFPDNQIKQGDVLCSVPSCNSKIRLKSISYRRAAGEMTDGWGRWVGLSYYDFEEVPLTTPETRYSKPVAPPPDPVSNAGLPNNGANPGNTPLREVAP